LEITTAADWALASKFYKEANPNEDKSLQVLADEGIVRLVWGRARIGRDIRVAANRATEEPLKAVRALFDRLHTQTYRGSDALRTDSSLATILADIEAGKKDPGEILCHTPSWVAARLWERRDVSGESWGLRRWVDLWSLLRHPAVTPCDVWRPMDAQAFREAAIDVISSETGLAVWPGEHAPPATLVDRALLFERRTIEAYIFETLEGHGEIFGLLRLLLADVVAEDTAAVPHPIVVRLVDLAMDRPGLFAGILFQVRQNPKVLADLLLYPPSSALACLLIAQWRSPPSAWDRGLIERDDRLGQTDAFADAAAVLGEYVRDGRGVTAESAALLNWFHDRSGPGFIDDATGPEILRETLAREIAGVPKAIVNDMAKSLDGPELRQGLGTSEFATVLELVDLGGLEPEFEPETLVSAYVQSIGAGEYTLKAHRVGTSAAAALAQLAARTPDLQRQFLYPLRIPERLAASTPDDNPFLLADSIARSIRAHIRILCRAIVGSTDDVSPDRVDALVAAIKQGAFDHQERNRVAAFAPRMERTIAGPVHDRALAADIGAALRALTVPSQKRLLDAVLETNEPLILAQLVSVGPPALHVRITERITALAPADAGNIRSHFEMQARIDELLRAGAADAAALYMAAEETMQTLGPVPGRDAARFRNQLWLQYLRNDWASILGAMKPAFRALPDQSSADDTLKLFQGVALLKGPQPDPDAAKAVFAPRRPPQTPPPVARVNSPTVAAGSEDNYASARCLASRAVASLRRQLLPSNLSK
jgi:hypothetical protein